MVPSGGSRTAVLVCQGRAAAHGRLAVGRFDDPVAAWLLTADELQPVQWARADELPPEPRRRLAVEWVRATAEVVAPRTVVIDDAVRAAGHPQVVLVGAGLDSRPWRMHELQTATVYAVDHPATHADTRRRSGGLEPVGRLRPVAVDLGRDDLGRALAAAGHDATAPTTWVWEGVVPYLTRAEVRSTVRALAARSAPGSVLVVNYQTGAWAGRLGRLLARGVHRLAGAEHPFTSEPWRSRWSPVAMRRLLAAHGFAVASDEDLLAVAALIGSPVRHSRSVRSGRVATAVAAGPRAAAPASAG